MRILVTGGAGYFGTILTDLALARGDTVRVLDLNEPEPMLADITRHTRGSR